MSLSLLLLTCAPIAGAQDSMNHSQDRMHQDGAMVHYASLEEMLGSDVRLDPSMEDRREAAEDDEMAKGPKGEVEDLVLDAEGRVRYAALSVGGFLGIGDKVALVPIDRINHVKTDDGMQCRLSMTKAEIEALPSFDPDEAKEENRLEPMVKAVDASYQSKPMDGSRGHQLLMASTLTDIDVRGTDDKFGEVSDAVINPQTKKVEYLIVSHGGAMGVGDDKYLLPMQALELGSRDEETVLMANRPVAQLENCVRYEKPEKGFVDAAALRRVDADFGVRRDGQEGMKREPMGKREDYGKKNG